MMSKAKILKGIQQQIENHGYNVVDYEVSGAASKELIAEIREKMDKLKKITEELEKLLM